MDTQSVLRWDEISATLPGRTSQGLGVILAAGHVNAPDAREAKEDIEISLSVLDHRADRVQHQTTRGKKSVISEEPGVQA